MSDESDGQRPGSFLTAVRQPGPLHVTALVVAAMLGIGLAWVHWLGLFAAGGLVGLVSRTLQRAVLAGVVVGGIVLVLQVLSVPAVDPAEFITLRPPVYVTLVAAFGAPVWGSLIRGVV